MKKSNVKRVINQSLEIYYKVGLTNTASKVREQIFKDLDKLWNKKRK